MGPFRLTDPISLPELLARCDRSGWGLFPDPLGRVAREKGETQLPSGVGFPGFFLGHSSWDKQKYADGGRHWQILAGSLHDGRAQQAARALLPRRSSVSLGLVSKIRLPEAEKGEDF